MKSLLVLALVVSRAALAQAASADGSFKQTSRLSVNRPIVEKLREIKSVADWGARCDGTTNDRGSIQNAINAAAAAGAGGFSLRLPAGNCNIGSTGLTFPANSPSTPFAISLRGDSTTGTRILYTGTGTAIAVGAAGSGTAGAAMVELRDFTLDTTGTSASASVVNGIVLNNVRGGLIENVTVVGTFATAFVGQSNTIANHWGIAILGGIWQADQSQTDYSVAVMVKRVTILGNWQHGIEVDGYNTNKSNGYTFLDTRVYPFTGGGTPNWGVPNLPAANGGPCIGFHMGWGSGDSRFIGTNDVTGADIAFQLDGNSTKGEFRSERNSVSVAFGPYSYNNDVALDNFSNATDEAPGASLPTLWTAGTTYKNDFIGWVPSGQYYVWSDNWSKLYRLTNRQNVPCTTGNGTGGAQGPPIGTRPDYLDGTCHWAYVSSLVPPTWVSGTYLVGQFVSGVAEPGNGFRCIKAGSGKSKVAPTSSNTERLLADGYAWSSAGITLYGNAMAIGGSNMPGLNNGFRHSTDIRFVPNPGGNSPGGVVFQNQNNGEFWLQLMAGATADQAKRIMFQRVDGTFWRINGDAVGTSLTVDDGVTTKLTFNPGVAQTNTVAFGTGAQLAPVLQSHLAAIAAPNGTLLYCSNCAASATCAAGGGTGRLAIRLNNSWSCVP